MNIPTWLVSVIAASMMTAILAGVIALFAMDKRIALLSQAVTGLVKRLEEHDFSAMRSDLETLRGKVVDLENGHSRNRTKIERLKMATTYIAVKAGCDLRDMAQFEED